MSASEKGYSTQVLRHWVVFLAFAWKMTIVNFDAVVPWNELKKSLI
jgi:hypothetical protein